MDINFGPGFFSRPQFKLPPRELLNLYPERAGSRNDRQFVLLRSPGLELYDSIQGLPIRALGYQRDQFSDAVFGLSGDVFFSLDTSGNRTEISTSVGGFNFTSFSFNPIGELVFASNGRVYSYNGTDLQQQTVDNSRNFVATEYLAGYFLAFPNDDDRFYFSGILDGRSWSSLDFSTAEQRGDNLVRGKALRDELWLFGTESTEVWVPTGDADQPFQRQEGVLINKGCAGVNAVALVDQTLYWVGDDLVVYRSSGYQAEAVSNEGINEILAAATAADLESITAFSYTDDGHQFVVFNLDSLGGLVYDTTTGEWHIRKSTGTSGYRAANFVLRNQQQIVGDKFTGNIYLQKNELFSENGVYMIREVTSWVPVRTATPCYNFTIDCTTGVGPEDGQNPAVQFSYSDDGGINYTATRQIPLGAQGQYTTRATTSRLGRMRAPGRVFKIRYTEKTEFALYGARINERTP